MYSLITPNNNHFNLHNRISFRSKMNSARKIATTIILDSFSTLQNLQKISKRFITFNPYLFQKRSDRLFPIINYSTVVRNDIEIFGKLLVKEKLAPPILRCEPLQNIFVSISSYFSSAKELEETYFREKLLKGAEHFNSSLRQLNENELEQKQLRQSLIIARNNIEQCLKQMKEANEEEIKRNQTLSRVLSYII